MIATLLSNILILCGLAILAAVVLYKVSKKFTIKQDPLSESIYDILPHVNCGGCGQAGCQAFAEICAKSNEEEFNKLNCPVGGNLLMEKIAKLKGITVSKKNRTCAVLCCNGTCEYAPKQIEYDGLENCRLANSIISGYNGCPNGCLRFGDCVKVCKFGALSINSKTGMPEVDYKKCTSCGACVKRCPRGLFEIRKIQDDSQVYVACRNQQKGAIARKNCRVACIGCGKCVKINDKIIITNNLSYIPENISPKQYGEKLAMECPTKAIHYRTKMTVEEKYEK